MMWGFSFSVWENVVKFSLIMAVVTGCATAVFAFVAGYVGYELADAVGKISEQRVADARIVADKSAVEVSKASERIAELGREAAKLGADAESSKAETAKANEAAAKAEQKTAELRIALDRAVAERSPRHLSNAQSSALDSLLSAAPKGPVVVNALWTDGEALGFALEILGCLQKAGFPATEADMGRRLIFSNQVGISLHVKDLHKAPPAAGPLAFALQKIGLGVTAAQDTNLKDDEIELVVGTHP